MSPTTFTTSTGVRLVKVREARTLRSGRYIDSTWVSPDGRIFDNLSDAIAWANSRTQHDTHEGTHTS